MIRRDVIYHGRVQGVGFRWTTNRLARDFAVS
ncbi:MAG: acylphosphatase, partial [Pirellulaceae bacterium]